QERVQNFTESTIKSDHRETNPVIIELNSADSDKLLLSRQYLVLPESDVVQKQYVADLSGLNFASYEEAQEFFNLRSGNLVNYQLDATAQKVVIILNLQFAESWGVKEWNKYLGNQFQR
ncbi:MAG: hypothetical protein ACK47F_00770, partial [Flavobacteriales bacterium]